MSSWRTRKRGTINQIGKKFPVLEKKKLPVRISLNAPRGGKAKSVCEYKGEPCYIASAVICNEKPELCRRRKQLKKGMTQEQIDELFHKKYPYIKRGGKIKTGKVLSREESERILKSAGWKKTLSAPKHVIDWQSWKGAGNRIILYPEDLERRKVTEEKLRKLMAETDVSKHAEILFDIKAKPPIKANHAVITDKSKMKEEIVIIKGKKYVKPDLSEYSPATRHFDPIKKEYLTLKQSKTAGLIPVREEKEVRKARAARKGVRMPAEMARLYQQYMKDIGMKKAVAEKIRAVKYPVEKRGPSYQRYLQKLRDKRTAEKVKRLR